MPILKIVEITNFSNSVMAVPYSKSITNVVLSDVDPLKDGQLFIKPGASISIEEHRLVNLSVLKRNGLNVPSPRCITYIEPPPFVPPGPEPPEEPTIPPDDASMPSLFGWWDVSDSSTIFQDDPATTPTTAAGQEVRTLQDKSTNGRDHAFRVTNGNSPEYAIIGDPSTPTVLPANVGGDPSPYITWRGTSSNPPMEISGTNSLSGPYTLSIVMFVKDLDPTFAFFGTLGAASEQDVLKFTSTTNIGLLTALNLSNITVTALSTDAWHHLMVTFDGASLAGYVVYDGDTQISTGVSTGGSGLPTIDFSGMFAGQTTEAYEQGRVCEYVVFEDVLTTQQRTDHRTYITDKWGI